MPLLVRPTAPPLWLGLVVAASLIVVESFLVLLLEYLAPGNTFGAVFLLGVLVVSAGWGFGLAVMTTLASALVYLYFHLETAGGVLPVRAEDWVAIVIFLPIALLANILAGQARLRAAEADHRRREAEASRDELSVLADQQAALRRVATLVARGATPSEVFAAVAGELARCLHVVNAGLLRYEADGTAIVVAVQYEPGITTMPVTGERIPLAGDNVGARVLHTGRAARIDSHEDASGPEAARIRAEGIHSIVGVPIIVDGRLWGSAIVGSRRPEPMPPDTEARIADFADLVGTAIANAATRAELQASRDELAVLAEQQAALRRVATLVARGVSPSEVFSVVADEMARCLHSANASVSSFENGMVTVVAVAALTPGIKRAPRAGERHTLLEGDNIASRVFHTGRAARLDGVELQNAPGSIAARLRKMGLRSTAAVPIIVDERVWGMAAVGSLRPEPLPTDTEARMSDFADLVATAIANAATRAELIASRARIVAAADETRRRLERDLHDGAQQRLVSLGLELRVAEALTPPERNDLKEQLSHIVSGLTGVSEDLREFSRWIHPAILSKGGLGSAIRTLARRSAVPVTVDVAVDRRLPESAEVAAYYVISETLTNVAKHAHASEVNVSARAEEDTLDLVIADDGVGGADSRNGSGLIGLMDRVEALGGHLEITSPVGSGTSLHVTIPLEPV
ncbi:GAF domain-containing protein [Rhodococcus sp. NPDC059968]|uniref:GAF domain-containing protein n=1 Tax=Rhodococcus sp. NPDC059968 TaxID=3347017 RepID=UPI00366F16C9